MCAVTVLAFEMHYYEGFNRKPPHNFCGFYQPVTSIKAYSSWFRNRHSSGVYAKLRHQRLTFFYP